jgi:hypothetical protein
MLTRLTIPTIGRGTPEDLILATELGARIAARRRRGEGIGDDEIRREIISSYKEDLASADFGEYELETLIGAVQRALEQTLAEPMW